MLLLGCLPGQTRISSPCFLRKMLILCHLIFQWGVWVFLPCCPVHPQALSALCSEVPSPPGSGQVTIGYVTGGKISLARVMSPLAWILHIFRTLIKNVLLKTFSDYKVSSTTDEVTLGKLLKPSVANFLFVSKMEIPTTLPQGVVIFNPRVTYERSESAAWPVVGTVVIPIVPLLPTTIIIVGRWLPLAELEYGCGFTRSNSGNHLWTHVLFCLWGSWYFEVQGWYRPLIY